MSQTTDEPEFDLENAVVSVDELDAEHSPAKPVQVEPDEPLMTDPEWPAFVAKHFREGETDQEGRPLVHGLRRVVRLLLGPIVRSQAKVVQAPTFRGASEFSTQAEPSVVEYTVEILMCRECDQQGAYSVVVTDAADSHFLNTDPDFARHGTAIASTRAEARCLRKLLQLRGIASEERTTVSVPDLSVDGDVSDTQLNFLNALGRRNDIDMWSYVNSGEKKYDTVYKIPGHVAAIMVQHLDQCERNGKFPKEVRRGYKADWRR